MRVLFIVALLIAIPAAAVVAAPPSGSIGRFNGGSLADGVPLPLDGEHHYALFAPSCYDPEAPPNERDNFYGNRRTVEAVLEVARTVRTLVPEAPRLPIGELSNRAGGRIPHHLSHQNGLDVDVYYLQRGDDAERPVVLCRQGRRFEVVDPESGQWRVDESFELAWNWHLAAAFAARRDVKVIFVGALIESALATWAREQGIPARERRATLAKLHPVFCRAPRGVESPFYRKNWCPHDDHFHVRFRCPRGDRRCRN